jgi:hypothetical protein
MATNDDNLTFDSATLESLAIQEQFLREWRAGRRPRLSVYALHYPAHAAALADLVASLPPDTQAVASDATDPMERAETPPASPLERLWNGAGVERALNSAFGDLAAPPALIADNPLPRVAEQRSAYETPHADDASAQRPTPERPTTEN